MAFLVYVDGNLSLLSAQGRRFTHWTFYVRMRAPLFHVFAAAITIKQILEFELELLRALWRRGSATVRDVCDDLNEVRPLGYT